MVKSKKSKKSYSKKKNSKERAKKSSTKSKKYNIDLKRPQTPFSLFSSKQKEELKKKGHNKKLTAKELWAMWEKLPKNKKKVFIDQYEEEKKKYYKLKSQFEIKSCKDSDVEEEKTIKKKITKVKAKTKKDEIEKINRKVINCGKYDECKKAKVNEEKTKEEECEKEKEPKEEKTKKDKEKKKEVYQVQNSQTPKRKNKNKNQIKI